MEQSLGGSLITSWAGGAWKMWRSARQWSAAAKVGPFQSSMIKSIITIWEEGFAHHLEFPVSFKLLLLHWCCFLSLRHISYLIELFWNNTKSLHFVLPLHILTVALSSVLILKKMPSFLPTSTTMLFIQIDYTFWESSPKSVVLPLICGAPLFLRRSPISVALPYFRGAPLNLQKNYSTNDSPKCVLLP